MSALSSLPGFSLRVARFRKQKQVADVVGAKPDQNRVPGGRICGDAGDSRAKACIITGMSTHDENTGPEGYNVANVEAWIAEHIDHLKPPLQWTRLQGGHSNLTYRIEDSQGHCAVIRRPPMGELLPKAHDMSREWAVISALGPTAVPVPPALGFCENPDVTGAWFYVMGSGGRPATLQCR